MYGLLDMRVDADHAGIQVGMIPHQDLRIPRTGHEYGIDATAKRRGEDVADLEADEEGEGNHNRSVGAILVVSGRGEDEVEVGEKRAGIGNKGRAHAEDGADETFIDKGVNSAVLDHPGSLSDYTIKSTGATLTSRCPWLPERTPFHRGQCVRRRNG